jgi:DNA-binding XRE family transcriptional regulator
MRTRKLSEAELDLQREELKRALRAGELPLGEAVRRMRKLTGLTQTEYAEKVLRIFPRVLMDIENGRGNPTLETLEKIARPWGFRVGFVPRTDL